MATVLLDGHVTWSMTRDEEGHRTYKIRHIVKSTTGLDGPANVLQTPGLPVPGALWLVDDDADVYAYVRLDADVSIWKEREGDPARYWAVEQTASTKPGKRCSETQFEDPLLEPPKVSIAYSKESVEATVDRHGVPITNSAWEPIRGPKVEFDMAHPSVTIEMNVADPQLALCQAMLNCVNQSTLWGLPPRSVRMSEFSAERKFYGQCYAYWTWRFKFDARTRTDPTTGFLTGDWDRTVMDEGTMCLQGSWNSTGDTYTLREIGGEPASPFNPAHFQRYKDPRGEYGRCVLDGEGAPVNKALMGAITNISDSQPMVVTSATNHLLTTGDVVGIFDVEGCRNANAYWYVIVESATTFSLWTAVDDEQIDESSPSSPYTGGGYWVRLTQGAGQIKIEKYGEADFALLGIPLDF